jgi:cephalosporin-C deacetylase-like acetyl esterase
MRLPALLPILLLGTPLGTPAVLAAQPAAPVLQITLDRADWRYAVGDSARFRVTLQQGGRPLAGRRVFVALGPERMPAIWSDSVMLTDGQAVLVRSMATPGFLRVTATALVGGARVSGMATAGFSPERLRDHTPDPVDFDRFWSDAVAEARKTPLEPIMTRLPERSTAEVDVYHVSFQNHVPGSRLYGMLSVPTKPGRYPAMLVVPGAGVRPYFPGVSTAQLGVIHLTIGIHGIPVDRDSLLYNELRATALRGYSLFGLEDRDAYYYKRVFVGTVRAGDFLWSLSQFDGTHYVVQGGSQGGALAMVAAVLDRRVQAVAVTHPALSDHFGYLHGRAGGWPHALADSASVRALAEKKRTLAYYDGVNFARRLRVPAVFAWGYNDTTVPPTSSWVTYNAVTSPKQVIIVPELGHVRSPEQVRQMDAWLLQQLGRPAPTGTPRPR